MKPLAAALIALTVMVPGCQAGNPPPRNPLGLVDLWLYIAATGPFEGLVLRDPKGRVNLIQPSGAESTFVGCYRADFPEQFGIPEGSNYARFEIRGPVSGPYVLKMRAAAPGRLWIATNGSWPGGGDSDAAWGELLPGDEVTATVRLTRDRRSSVGAFALTAEPLKVKRRRP